MHDDGSVGAVGVLAVVCATGGGVEQMPPVVLEREVEGRIQAEGVGLLLVASPDPVLSAGAAPRDAIG